MGPASTVFNLQNCRVAAKTVLVPYPAEGQKETADEYVSRFMELDGGQGRNRTTDTRIFSPLLYQLSYLALLSAGNRAGSEVPPIPKGQRIRPAHRPASQDRGSAAANRGSTGCRRLALVGASAARRCASARVRRR